MAQTRNKKPVTVTLSPEALEAIKILEKELGLKNRSQVIEALVKDALTELGYEPKDK